MSAPLALLLALALALPTCDGGATARADEARIAEARAVEAQAHAAEADARAREAEARAASPTPRPPQVRRPTEDEDLINEQVPDDDAPFATTRGGDWLLVLGSFPHAERGRADAVLRRVRAAGASAEIAESSGFPNLRAGLLVVVEGPFAQATARRRLAALRATVPDAYVKRGW